MEGRERARRPASDGFRALLEDVWCFIHFGELEGGNMLSEH